MEVGKAKPVEGEAMTVRELKDKIENVPDDSQVVVEGRFGEILNTSEVDFTELPEYEGKVLVIS